MSLPLTHGLTTSELFLPSWVGSAEHFLRQRIRNVKRSAFGVSHERDPGVLRQPLGASQVNSACQVRVDSVDRPPVQIALGIGSVIKPYDGGVDRRTFQYPRVIRPRHENVAGLLDTLQNPAVLHRLVSPASPAGLPS